MTLVRAIPIHVYAAVEVVATVFLVGFGFAHMALTAPTRFSRPLGA